MSSTIIYPFTTPGNYTLSDAALIEVSGGNLQPKDILLDNLVSAATYTTNKDLNYGGASITGTISGTVVISGGYADMTDAGIDYISYPVAGNVDGLTTKGTVILRKFKPNWTGNPAGNRFIFAFGNVADNKNRTYTYIDTAGTIRAAIFNNAGAQIDLLIKSGTSWAIQDYELAFCWDLTPGSEYQGLYLDRTRVDSGSASGTRDATMDTFHVGTGMTAGADSDFSVGSIECYDDCLFTGASYSAQDALPESRYSLANPYADVNATFRASELLTFTETATKSGSDEMKYAIDVGGQLKWSNGGTVENSDGTYAQANTNAEITAVIGDFLSTRIVTGVRSFCHVDSGATQTRPQLDTLTITYDSTLPDATLSNLRELEGWIYDHDTPLTSEPIKIRPKDGGFVNGDVVHRQRGWEALATTNSDGWFEADIYVQPTGKSWELKVRDSIIEIQLEDIETNELKDVVIDISEDE
jgi:hypothetical protein